MTPCPNPPPYPCDIICTPDPCPANQTCYRVAEGYQDGYCSWTPPYGNTTINCDQIEPPCCCHCVPTGNELECANYVEIGSTDPDAVIGCEGARVTCEGMNSLLIHNEPSPCCTMSEPKNGSVITMLCNNGGCLCTPCNRVAKPRVPVDPSKPYPFSDFYAPCYMPDPIGFADPSDPINKPIRPDFWNEITFAVDGLNPCADDNKCRGSCRVYAECSLDPESAAIGNDQCKVGRFGQFCYEPDFPASECAEPVYGTCVALCSCEFGPPSMLYQEFSCDGLGPIPYCTFYCPPEPCLVITCPPGYYCDNYATPHCQPI